MRSIQLSDLAQRTHQSIRGQTESLVELWHAHQHMRAPVNATLLNSVAPHLFGTLDRCAFQCVLLLIRQLTEAATVRVRGVVRTNSSMRGLLHVAFGKDYETVVPELSTIIQRAESAAASPNEWADKAVAHTDLLVGLDHEPLPPLSWTLVQICVDLIVRFVQAFESAAGIPRSSFSKPVLGTEVEALVKALQH